MKVYLLYRDHERILNKSYHDPESIIQDLGLKALFAVGSKEVIYDKGAVKELGAEDGFIRDTLSKILMEPLTTKEEILYRQEIVAESIKKPELMRQIYEISSRLIEDWDKACGGSRKNVKQGSQAGQLIMKLSVLRLFCDALAALRELLAAREDLSCEGLRAFRETMLASFSKERESNVRKLLEDVSFYTDGAEVRNEDRVMEIRPRVVLECGLRDDLKFGPMKVHELESKRTKFLRRGSTRDKIRRLIDSRMPDSFPTFEDVKITEQTMQLEYELVAYLERKMAPFREEFHNFFDQLKLQSAFYYGAALLKQHMDRFGLPSCFPTVCDRRDMEFEDLKEFVMAIEQRIFVVGNTCSMKKKDMLIVTGANQGGKSTFLRSIGIAIVMMQSGLPVTARSFRSGIFPRVFVHFTRREDSEMNSGRLDEELRRMSDIVDHIGEGSLILLNESFATTTEKEGAQIAYDILRALKEAGVRILTVTHLHSFAKRVYDETPHTPDSDVEFLTAERGEDGTRTFRMIPGKPDLSSFGLDLYDTIVTKALD